MNFLKPVTYSIAAGVTLAALALPADKAEARVIAYSSLQITNFQITEGAGLVEIKSIANTTTSAANLDGTAQSGAANNLPGDADVDMSCVGLCGGIMENDYSRHSAIVSGDTFARGDAQLTGSLLAGGANGKTVAETQLIGMHASSAGGAIQSSAGFTTIEFDIYEDGGITLSFDVSGELRVSSSEAGGVAQADFDFNISLRNLTDPGPDGLGIEVPIETSSFNGASDFSSLNKLASIAGAQTQNYTIDDVFYLTVNGLLANNQYRLQISQNADISARSTRQVAEPAFMGLLGFGLLGVAGLARRRKTA